MSAEEVLDLGEKSFGEAASILFDLCDNMPRDVAVSFCFFLGGGGQQQQFVIVLGVGGVPKVSVATPELGTREQQQHR